MEHEFGLAYINDWLERGMLSKEFILGRLDQEIKTSCSLREEERLALKRSFQSVCTDEGLLTEAGFISLLQAKTILPHFPEGIEISKALYTSLAYLSTLPFPKSPEKTTSHPGLSLAQLTRCLVWALPGNHKYIMTEDNFSRARTKSDHRRIIFQSLAFATHDKPYDPKRARQLALQNALDVDTENDLIFALSNHDDDGDEIYHDLLDVLYSMQPENLPLAPVTRDSFRSIAKRIGRENELASLHSIGIPIELFVSLVKLFLALQFESPSTRVDLNQFNAAAQSISSAFCEEKNSGIITWPMFNYGLRNVVPYLLDPFYHLLSMALLEDTGEYFLMTPTDPPTTVGGILGLPHMSQLSTFLIGCIDFDALRRMEHYSGLDLPTPAGLVSAIESVPDEAIVVLSGSTATGKNFIFGVFSPKPLADRTSVQSLDPNHLGLEPCSIFQLAPTQDIFRGVAGRPGWILDDEGVVFGQSGGVRMALRDGLSRIEITHEVSKGDETTEVYKSNPWRSSWALSIAVSEIEIWSEPDL
ncbi:uncharacterized protein N7459_003785 [Penicillium hispanicum]|uniref:uncharacterized protein n=1 Tax=Penicillium hispanicum TaxID=1080232 RepID=UPI00254112F3|nr:uncharacterized protein N7459_003785 [Penicillium hispanicum]KAJ5583985.1 hypothetical protein N7459_003785 [Penicillium hispanicum]